MPRQTAAPIQDEEVAYFSASVDHWWEHEGGTFQQLHRLNPLRLSYVKSQAASHWGRKVNASGLLKGLSVLDIGCGGGLLTEPLTSLGARVTGLDASPETIEVAKRHAAEKGLAIDYRIGTAEILAQTEMQFDMIVAMEVIEHVDNLASFLRALSRLLSPGGLLFVATINRTVKSYFLSIVMAEYVLGWVGEGMHDWDRFVRPSELMKGLEENDLITTDLTGISYDLGRGTFVLRPQEDLGVNYILTARK